MSHSNGLSTLDIRARLKLMWCAALLLATVMAVGGGVRPVGADPGRHLNTNFASVPTTVKARANDSIMLPCKHNAHRQYIRWIRDGDLLLDSREPDLLPPDRFAVDAASGSLHVAAVRDADNGEYVCEVMTPHGLATQVHAIEVSTTPTVLSVPSGTVELNVGAVFEIVCEPRGVPYPIITWRHNGRSDHRLATSNNSRRLLVDVSDRHMAGRIECVATNGVGEATAGVDLLVLFPPEVQTNAAVIHTKLTHRAYLECEVIAHPVANVHWFHHGLPVAYDQRIARQDSTDTSHDFTVSQTTALHTRSRHVLIIKKVREKDLGTYECQASNKLGYTSAQLQLTGRPMPSVFKTSPEASEPMTHNMIWQTESLSPIIEYYLRFWQVPSGNVTPNSRQHQNRHQHGGRHGQAQTHVYQLVIPAPDADGPMHTIGYVLKGLQPATVYEVSVTSKNRYGESDASKTIRFATGGEIVVPDYSTEAIDYTPIMDSQEIEESSRTDNEAEAAITPATSASSYSDYTAVDSSASRRASMAGGALMSAVVLVVSCYSV